MNQYPLTTVTEITDGIIYTVVLPLRSSNSKTCDILASDDEYRHLRVNLTNQKYTDNCPYFGIVSNFGNG